MFIMVFGMILKNDLFIFETGAWYVAQVGHELLVPSDISSSSF